MAKTTSKDPKQIRARARRKARNRDAAIKALYRPIDEWDEEELARGRPRAEDGTFRGSAPKWISREIHEEALKRFKDYSQSELQALVPRALATIEMILTSEETDEKGRSFVPMATKLDAAKWVVEHLVGKPTQRTELDISVKLQAVLASALVTPDAAGELQPAIDAEAWEDED